MCFAALASEPDPSPVAKSSFKKIHGEDCQRFVVVRFGIAARAGIGGSACDSDRNASARAAICYSFHPFHEVGGDFLDFFTLTDGAIGIYLGDVAGKGLPAALYTALAVGTLRGVHKTGTPPSSVLSLLNRRVTLRGVTPRYAAVQYACLDPRTGILRIASAGMTGPVLLSAQGNRELDLRGIPPGMFPETEYDSETVQLQCGDSVIFLSDGFCEAQNSEGEF